MKRREILDVFYLVIIILVIIFGLFLLYQVILKILGGSWTTEAVVISLLVLLISMVFVIASSQIKLSVDYGYFKRENNRFREYIYKELREIKDKI
jgi:hydrogenase-4 membrane subunit HyfE